jgi:hypothetical protein
VKAIFGVLSLVVALAVVGMVAKRQLQATGSVVSQGLPGVPGVEASAPVSQQVKAIEEKTRAGVERALQQGAQRNQGADP